MYDILVYLFENCQQAELAYDRDRVAKKLSAAGFEDSDISEALHWLAGVLRAPHGVREPLPDSRVELPRLRAARAGQARRALPRLPADARALGHPQRRHARAGDRARARRVRRHAQPRAAQAGRADGAVEPADADQPPARRGPLQRAARAPAELAAFSRGRMRLNRGAFATYHLRPFAPHGQETHHRRETVGRGRHRARARRLHAQGRLLRERATTCSRPRSAICSSWCCPRSTTSSAASGRSRTCR